jgi:hypothetical protein
MRGDGAKFLIRGEIFQKKLVKTLRVSFLAYIYDSMDNINIQNVAYYPRLFCYAGCRELETTKGTKVHEGKPDSLRGTSCPSQLLQLALIPVSSNLNPQQQVRP